MEVLDIALSQCGPTSDRQLAIIDKNGDMYLAPVKHIGAAGKFVRLGIVPFYFSIDPRHKCTNHMQIHP
jgi:hypothetical protein